MSLVKKLADKHEEFVHQLLGGHRAKSSGNQWNDPADGRTSRFKGRFGFAWDCKCAMPGTKSISITREMLTKIVMQAHGERPAIPIRFYNSERGSIEHDWIAIRISDFAELLEYAEEGT